VYTDHYTHATYEGYFVVEAIPNQYKNGVNQGGVIVRGIQWWDYNNKERVEVRRVCALTPDQQNYINDFCRAQIGKPYQPLLRFPYKDSSINAVEWYCSELVWAVYLNLLGIDFDTSTWGSSISPDELYYNPWTYRVGSYDYRYLRDSAISKIFKSIIRVARDPNAKYGSTRFVLPSQTLNYTIEFENEGDGTAFGVYITDILSQDLNASTLIIGQGAVYEPSTRTVTWSIGEIGPHEKGNVTYSVNVAKDAPIGTEIVNYATVYFPSVPETTRTNGVVNVVSYAHDVAVLDIESFRAFVGRSYSSPVNVTFENQGVNSESFSVELFANTTLLSSENMTLENGQYSDLAFAWNTTGFAYGNYTLSVWVEPIPGEVDVADNNLTRGWILVSIPGDINFDRKVDLKDVFAVGKAFGAVEGDSRYNPSLDINDDAKIDLKDYYVTCKNYGKSW
jgi:uncharacterized repeat protein (TIGR01451 family)